MSGVVTLEPWGSGDLPLLERLMGDPRMTKHLGGPESPDKLRERQYSGAVPDSESPLELCRRYRDAFFARDVEAILALVTPDFVFDNVTAGERVEGIDAVRSHIASIHSRWPDMRFLERDEGIMSGEQHAVAEWTALATHPDTGESIEWDGIDLIQVRDGRICRNAVYSSAHRARPQVPARTGADT